MLRKTIPAHLITTFINPSNLVGVKITLIILNKITPLHEMQKIAQSSTTSETVFINTIKADEVLFFYSKASQLPYSTVGLISALYILKLKRHCHLLKLCENRYGKIININNNQITLTSNRLPIYHSKDGFGLLPENAASNIVSIYNQKYLILKLKSLDIDFFTKIKQNEKLFDKFLKKKLDGVIIYMQESFNKIKVKSRVFTPFSGKKESQINYDASIILADYLSCKNSKFSVFEIYQGIKGSCYIQVDIVKENQLTEKIITHSLVIKSSSTIKTFNFS